MTTKTEQKLEWLICCCCGLKFKGRQWHNRDTGYGLCNKCATEFKNTEHADTMKSHYGIEGVHYLASN